MSQNSRTLESYDSCLTQTRNMGLCLSDMFQLQRVQNCLSLSQVPRGPVPEQADVCCHIGWQDRVHLDAPVPWFQGLPLPIFHNLVQEGVKRGLVAGMVWPNGQGIGLTIV